MTKKWLAAAIILGGLGSGPAKANVTYTLFDMDTPTTVDLEFTVATQLSLTETPETFLSVGGVYGSDYAGAQAEYMLAASNPVISFSNLSFGGDFVFTSTSTTPGNGSFLGGGNLFTLSGDSLAFLVSATVSGAPVIPVPEPSTWALLCLGFSGLAALSLRKTRGGRLGSALG
jgi:hypothetical protein